MTAPRRVPQSDPSRPAAPSVAGGTPLVLMGAEQEIVARLRAGDRSAFDTLFDDYYAALCEFAAALLGSDAVAEECVQDVFLRLWRHRAGWVVRDSLRRYLYGAVRNQALNLRKHERVADRWAAAAEHDHAIAGMGSRPGATDAQAVDHDLAAAIDRVVQTLPPRRRMVYTLRWQRGLPNAEIAELLGISVKGVEMQLVYALRTLRQALAHLV